LQVAAPLLKQIPTFLYHSLPPALTPWGLGGVLRYLLPDQNVNVFALEDPEVTGRLASSNVATLTWVERSRKLWVAARTPTTEDAAYILMNEVTPVWQLQNGWYGLEDGFRWTAPATAARLYRPKRARQFEVVLMGTGPPRDMSVHLNGAYLGSVSTAEPGVRTVRWQLPPGPPGPVKVEFQAPAYRPKGDSRTLGTAIISFGFLPSDR